MTARSDIDSLKNSSDILDQFYYVTQKLWSGEKYLQTPNLTPKQREDGEKYFNDFLERVVALTKELEKKYHRKITVEEFATGIINIEPLHR